MNKNILLFLCFILCLTNYTFGQNKGVSYSVERLSADWVSSRESREIVMQKVESALIKNVNDLSCVLLKIEFYSDAFNKAELTKAIEKAKEILKMSQYAKLKETKYQRINGQDINMHDGLLTELNSTLSMISKLTPIEQEDELKQSLNRPLSKLSFIDILKKLESIDLYGLYNDATNQTDKYQNQPK